MDSVEEMELRRVLSQQGVLLGRQQEELAASSGFPTELSRVANVIALLVGQAREWGTAMWDADQACCESFEAFSEEMRKFFDRSAQGIEAARALSVL